MQKVLSRIESEIADGTFVYRQYFPSSKLAKQFEATKSATVLPAAMATENIVQVVAPSFSEFIPVWVREMQPNWRNSTRGWMDTIINVHLLPVFGARIISQIKREDLLSFRADLSARTTKSGRPISTKTVNTVMRVLRAILTEAAARFGFTAPPTIKRLKVQRKEILPFTLEEVNLILSSIRADYKSYLTTAFFTGMRPGEINGLKWEHVDFERREIRVRETFSKGKVEYTKTDGSQREISMSAPVYEALKQQQSVTKKLGAYVFCLRNGEPLNDGNYSKRVWHPLLRHLGLRRRVPYQTRHTCATLWLAAGENPQWIASQLGHTTTEMLFRVYSRFVPNLTRRDGAAFEQLLINKGITATADAK
jgi:integrase